MPVASKTVSDWKLTLPKNLSSDGRRFLTAVESDKLTSQESQQKEPDLTQLEPKREEGPKQSVTEGQRARRCDRPAWKKNNSPRMLDREIARTGNLPKKLLINSQNPQPYSFVKLPLFIEGYFNLQLKTFSNIHYLLMSILTHNSQLLTRVPHALQLS